MNNKHILVIGYLFTFIAPATAATAPTAQDERALEILRQDKQLRSRIEEEQKVHIEKIVIRGSILSKEELEQVELPFIRRWLGKKDIEGLFDSIKQIYERRGQNPPVISSKISENNILEIMVEQAR